MLVSVDIRPTITSKQYVADDKRVISLFALLAFGYMVPWVTIGSLIRYFSDEYGNSFFVILNVAFYAVGYPVSYLQRRVDLYYDTVYGSQTTFRRRIQTCMVLLAGCVLLLPVLRGALYVIAVTIIGIFTWTAHGSSSALASVVKHNSNIVQQIGFALPGVFALLMNATYHMDTDSTRARFTTFYVIVAMGVFVGFAAWLVLGRSDVIKHLLEAKDDSVRQRVHNAIIGRRSRKQMELGDESITISDFNSSIGSAAGDIRMNEVAEDDFSIDKRSTMRNPLLDESKFYNDALLQAVLEDPKLLSEALESPELRSLLKLHMRTLFITIYCSILQGAFIAYTPSSSGSNSVVIVLFYTRLFMDLLGRPVALLRRPPFFRTIEWLLFWAWFRLGMMIFFFIYIAVPEQYFFRNDIFIIGFQSLFSVLSGYFNSLTFEYAANIYSEEWKRLQGAQVLSITFQQACLAAVVTATIILVVLHTVSGDI